MAYDNIKLEKGLYTTGKSFTDALEQIDPSENYKGTSLEGLDAYQRQLKRFDIKVSGNDSDTVSKFFSTTDSAALFPEYISRAVRTGLEDENKIEKIIATTTNIDSLDYRSIESVISADDRTFANIAEGETFPEATITVKDSLTELHKHGKMLVASYEAIKYQRLDLFTVTLRQIGNYISNSEFADAVSILSDNENLKTVTSETGTVTYSDLVNLWKEFSPYKMTTMICAPSDIANMLMFDEFKDSTAGLNFHATGNMITPFGAEIVRYNDANDGTILAIDKSCALEKVQAGGIVTDFDKLIDRQLERATISTIVGFSRIFDDATCVLNS
ncbi:MAG: phage major capsid protein [Clostridiales bacterium]|nr:phage major capsid protein [Clostridiales bacterium]